MATTLRPELSTKNKYWIRKHRYYELKHFCLQYPFWKRAYDALDGFAAKSTDPAVAAKSGEICDPTGKCAVEKNYYKERMEMVERVAEQADPVLGKYILEAVTEGWSYDVLKARLDIPCCKDVYYDLYRKFFWLLDKERG